MLLQQLFCKKLGQAIREAREKQQISIQELSRLTSVPSSYITNFEIGFRRTNRRYIVQLCKALGLCIKDIELIWQS